MKKSIVATLTAALLTASALGLAACQKKHDDDTPPDDTPDTYSVTFNVNGGAWSATATDNANKIVTTGADGKVAFPADPQKADNTFKGWFTAATGGEQRASSYIFTQDTTLYAQWTANGGTVQPPAGDTTYTITLDANGGTLTGAATVTTDASGKLTTLPAAPTPADATNTFKGWYTAFEGGTKVEAGHQFSGNATIYAQWQAQLVETGCGVYVGGTLVAALEDNSENIADVNDPETQGKASREYMVRDVQLSPGDVVSFKIDDTTLTHTANTLEMWSANCHGVKFNQSAGTFTVKPGETRTFDIYVRFYTEAERKKGNPNDKGDCWSIEINDGITEVLEEGAYYLIGTITDWQVDPEFKIGDGIVYEFTTEDQFKVKQYNNPANDSVDWLNSVTSDSAALLAQQPSVSSNAMVKTAGSYKITVVDGKFKVELA